ncbi:MAG: M56 family metallopeptidase [Bacteroides sp.]|nr:M56 family metallopeptidase [Bacteroides sp.]MCM1550703.1 M56 family metallopeptidase [Clostridium sp.]
MNWISYIVYALVLTTLTGSVWTVLWCITCGLLKPSGNNGWSYRLLKLVMSGYMIPVLFLLLLVDYQLSDSMTGFLFQTTPDVEAVLRIVFAVWLAGLLVCGLIYISRRIRFHRICKSRLPVSQDVTAMVKRLGREWNINKPIRVCQGYSVMVPFIYGIRRPCIFLPVCTYSQRELEMILTHELIHYRQRDVFWKPAFVAVCCIFWFNPLVWLVAGQFQKWAEASCDRTCCENQYSAKEYFTIIYNMVNSSSPPIRTFAPSWFSMENELSWRVKIMRNYQRKKQRKWVTAVVTSGAILLSTVCTFGAEAGLRQMYTQFYMETAPATEEAYTPVEELPSYTAEEEVGTLADFEGMEVIQEDDTVQPRSGIINWTVENKVVKQTAQFDKNAGDTIYVSVIVTPTDKTVRVGILEPDGQLRYVTGSGSIVHSFTVSKEGKHRVYVYNNSGTTVTVTGAYN